jgi:uracil-DNA glycosylase family 4
VRTGGPPSARRASRRAQATGRATQRPGRCRPLGPRSSPRPCHVRPATRRVDPTARPHPPKRPRPPIRPRTRPATGRSPSKSAQCRARRGQPHADFVVRGRGAGGDEDETGRPFVGRIGQLLTKILEAINLSREDVFICNVIKHRPPGNRNPKPDEVAACRPFLLRQLELLRAEGDPRVGTFAAQTLLGRRPRSASCAGTCTVPRGPARRDVPPGRAAAEPRLEAPHLGRCPARPSNTRSRHRRVTLPRPPPPTRRTRSRPCSRRCSRRDAIMRAPSSSTTRCSTGSGTAGSSARCRRSQRGDVVDPLTLSDELGARASWRRAGGKEYIGWLRRRGPDGGQRRVPREDRPREGAAAPPHRGVDEHRHRGLRGAADRAELLDDAEHKIFQISQRGEPKASRRIKELLWPAMERIEALQHGGGRRSPACPRASPTSTR